MSHPPQNITLVISSLMSGGAERVMTNIANFWAGRGRNVTILTFDDGNVPPFYPLDPRVRHEALGLEGISGSKWQGMWRNLQRVLRLRQALVGSHPDVIVSFIAKTNVLTLLASRGIGMPVVVSERTDPNSPTVRGAWEGLRSILYPMATRIVVQTERAAAYFQGSMQARISVIPNPVFLPAAEAAPSMRLDSPGILSVGRLSREKGHDTLIRAFGLLAERFPDWSLTILGEGPLRGDLEALRDSMGLQDKVHLPGRTKDPFGMMRQAEFFVLPSRQEGFPNALCEAMACGLPVISADCPCGPREIIRENVDGLLVPPDDPQALAEAMSRLMDDAAFRHRLARHAGDVLERFNVERIMALWEAVIQPASKGSLVASASFARHETTKLFPLRGENKANDGSRSDL